MTNNDKQISLLEKMEQLDPNSPEFNKIMKQFRQLGQKSNEPKQGYESIDYQKPYAEDDDNTAKQRLFDKQIIRPQKKAQEQTISSFDNHKINPDQLVADTKKLASTIKILYPANESAAKMSHDLDQNLSQLYQINANKYRKFIDKNNAELAKFDDKAFRLGIKVPQRQINALIKADVSRPAISANSKELSKIDNYDF